MRNCPPICSVDLPGAIEQPLLVTKIYPCLNDRAICVPVVLERYIDTPRDISHFGMFLSISIG